MVGVAAEITCYGVQRCGDGGVLVKVTVVLAALLLFMVPSVKGSVIRIGFTMVGGVCPA